MKPSNVIPDGSTIEHKTIHIRNHQKKKPIEKHLKKSHHHEPQSKLVDNIYATIILKFFVK